MILASESALTRKIDFFGAVTVFMVVSTKNRKYKICIPETEPNRLNSKEPGVPGSVLEGTPHFALPHAHCANVDRGSWPEVLRRELLFTLPHAVSCNAHLRAGAIPLPLIGVRLQAKITSSVRSGGDRRITRLAVGVDLPSLAVAVGPSLQPLHLKLPLPSRRVALR